MSVFLNKLTALTAGVDDITAEMLSQMAVYQQRLAAASKQFNLTAITGPEESALLHFFDSIVPRGLLPEGADVVDVGSGAGFPIVPLKIVRPDITATALEASGKKCGFIAEASAAAGIDVKTVCERAEDAARGALRGRFDVCVSRAVAALPLLLELMAPLARRGGLLLAYKGEGAEDELKQARNAVAKLHLRPQKAVPMPIEGVSHSVLVFEKTTDTPAEFPRRYAQIKKNPL